MRIAAVLGVAALLPVLGGCIIYSSEGGEKVSVNVADRAAARPEALESVRRVDFDGQRLSVVVGSNGCTEASSFEVRIKDDEPAELSLIRRSPDMCKALVPDGKTVSWTYDELGLKPGQSVRVINPISL